MSYYKFTLQHDKGKISITTYAETVEEAMSIVCQSEHCPENAIVDIVGTQSYTIDALSKGARRICSRLKMLIKVMTVSEPAAYWQDQQYCQIIIDSYMSESEIDHWLWENNLDYIGVTETESILL
jgi:hypothetical protein